MDPGSSDYTTTQGPDDFHRAVAGHRDYSTFTPSPIAKQLMDDASS